jgi:hypothetical protein
LFKSPGNAENWLMQTTLFRPGIVLWSFTATTFLSAFLLFSVQPMFAKMVLPVLGGSSSVWAVAIFFFQAALLAGYCYAHMLIANAPVSWTGLVHLGLCLLAFMTLPIGLPTGWSEPPLGEPYFWQLGLFTAAIGLPFAAISANAPLLQAWFARSGHPHGGDPYFLYAASNLGSLGALLMYPFVLEPALELKALSILWSIGYALLVAALALILLLASRHHGANVADPAASGAQLPLDTRKAAPTWSDRLSWIGLALVPAALLTAFTTHITTDIASAPLLWVIPLSIYLLTFVLVFRERLLIGRKVLLNLHLLAVAVALLALSQTWYENWFLSACAGVVVFFTSAMVAHRALYDARPAARSLTEFYLWMSFGGALGGLTAALLAPMIFNEVFEYPLLLALSVACRPGAVDGAALRRLGISIKSRVISGSGAISGLTDGDKEAARAISFIVGAGFVGIYCVWALAEFEIPAGKWNVAFLAAALFTILLFWRYKHPAQQMAAALLMCCAVILLPSAVRGGDAQRSYYGVHRVQTTADDKFRTLWHGTTVHGAQRIRDSAGNPVDDTTPAIYYYPNGPIAQTIAKVQERLGGEKRRFGIVGLGTGSLACYAKEGEAWRFFEIDPVVVRIARDPKYFTFLSKCQSEPDIVLGDARLTIAKEPGGRFDLIIVDAFSSGSVPVHLITAEALKLYLDKVKPDGIVLLHISHDYLDLESVFSATLKLLPGAHGFTVTDDKPEETDDAESVSTVALFAKTSEALEPLRSLAGITELEDGGLRGWTDDYSDIFGPFLRKLKED